MRIRFILTTLITATLAATPALAADDLWVAARAGTQGLGLEATWRPVPYLDLRLGFSTYDYDTTMEEAGIDYDVDLELESAYITLNARVPLSPFRFSAGLVSNGNQANFLAQDTGTYNIGGQTFSGADVGNLRGQLGWDDVSPYAGVGLDFRLVNRVGIHFDAGAMYQGAAAATLTADGPLAGDPQFQAALEAERAEFEDSASDYEWYPVVAVSFSVNF